VQRSWHIRRKCFKILKRHRVKFINSICTIKKLSHLSPSFQHLKHRFGGINVQWGGGRLYRVLSINVSLKIHHSLRMVGSDRMTITYVFVVRVSMNAVKVAWRTSMLLNCACILLITKKIGLDVSLDSQPHTCSWAWIALRLWISSRIDWLPFALYLYNARSSKTLFSQTKWLHPLRIVCKNAPSEIPATWRLGSANRQCMTRPDTNDKSS
jgi:hypothetical protein